MSLIRKVLIGAEDCLLTDEYITIQQRRASGMVTVHPLNASTIPYSGTFGESSFVSIKEKIDEALSGGGGGGTDELVKTTSSDPTAGYLSEKMDSSQFIVSSNRMRIRDSVLMIGAMNDIDISSRNDGYAVVWSDSQNRYIHQYISGGGGTGTDELVKADSTDGSAGYLADKLDNLQFDLNTSSSSHYLTIKNYGQVKFISSGPWGYLYDLVDHDTIKSTGGTNPVLYVDNSSLFLSMLGDVDTSARTDGSILVWDASALKYVHQSGGGGGDGFTHWQGTEDEYNSLSSYDDNTIYLIRANP